MPRPKRCETCGASCEAGDGAMECHRRAPQTEYRTIMVPIADTAAAEEQRRVFSAWPLVDRMFWCLDWVPQLAAPPEPR